MNKSKLKVLFVYSSHNIFARKHLVTTQGASLQKRGVSVEYYDISGNKWYTYLKHIKSLRHFIKEHDFDLVHAQFGYSGFTCAFAHFRPLIVSLMGTDFRLEVASSLLTRLFAKLFWDYTIVKSPKMFNSLKIKKSEVIPNGIDFARFNPIDREIARRQVGFSSSAHVLWVSDPERKEKNFDLAREALGHLDTDDVELTVVNNVELDQVPFYYYAADVLLVTSKWEGSPNVVKEAMACSLPIVSTDVGDVIDITKNTNGCYITSADPESVAKALELALSFGKRTNGREKVKYLDVDYISERLLNTYQKVLSGKK
ncbi:glycosyltransferase family 4 protein [Plebeiibacterium marinum]|uniref:Glycosyltransferase family 4 protein n=1 Tax=Plebeiibacterium marinum TaxID=2992111 RepID=A0AAE3MB64_9BACT|nr:glycosyltransferase family 4 protein [Plebeiobacterium marinum]MCW3804394.1 glycosyltransferase family 4 protein [Plebeiobacterium marinum]